MVTLRFLTTGDSQQSQSFLFRIGRATVSHIIRETCAAIWTALQGQYVIAPKTTNDWVGIANEFKQEWHFPNCIGATDGKHAMMECPKDGGSAFTIIRDSIASSCWLFVMPSTASLYRILEELDLQTMPVYCPSQTQEGFLRNPHPHSVFRAILHMVVKPLPMLLSVMTFFP